MKNLTMLIGCRDNGQTEAASAFKAIYGKGIQIVDFWVDPFGGFQGFGLYSNMIAQLLSLRVTRRKHELWTMSPLELAGLANFMHYGNDIVGIRELLDSFSDIRVKMLMLQPEGIWLDYRDHRMAGNLSRYFASAVMARQRAEDIAVMDRIAEDLSMMALALNSDFDTVKFCTQLELQEFIK